MSFLTGKQKSGPSMPQDLGPLRQSIMEFLQQQGFGTAISGPQGGPTLDTSPYKAMFAQNRAEAVAGAKEQAGNLTGSGLGNVIGAAAGRSVAGENAFLANLINSNQQAAAERYTRLLGGISTAGVSTPQTYYQPGFLDYLFQGASQGATGASQLGWQPFAAAAAA